MDPDYLVLKGPNPRWQQIDANTNLLLVSLNNLPPHL